MKGGYYKKPIVWIRLESFAELISLSTRRTPMSNRNTVVAHYKEENSMHKAAEVIVFMVVLVLQVCFAGPNDDPVSGQKKGY